MTDSQKLIAEYVRAGSEAAFREIVTRYVDLVYSAGLRLVEGDAHRAEDVAQIVFSDLARMAPSLPQSVMLGGWLHRHTCYIAGKMMRGERRRKARERQAAEMSMAENDSSGHFSELAPLLDEAINELGEADRMAILLRFFDKHDFQSVGRTLGSSEDAVRMRVNRALGKLGSLLKRRGVETTAAALAMALPIQAVQAAPAGLPMALSISAALAGSNALGAAIATQTFTMTTIQKTFLTAALIVGAATPLVVQHQSKLKLRAENEVLRQRADQLAQQAAANGRRSAELAESAALSKAQFEELLQLRGEVGLLRRRTLELERQQAENVRAASASPAVPDAVIEPEVHPRHEWALAGFETPEDALETSAWAIRQGDIGAFLASTTPAFQARFQDAATVEGLNGMTLNTKEYRIVNRDERSDDEVILHVSRETFDGKLSVVPLGLKKIDGAWKVALPGEM